MCPERELPHRVRVLHCTKKECIRDAMYIYRTDGILANAELVLVLKWWINFKIGLNSK